MPERLKEERVIERIRLLLHAIPVRELEEGVVQIGVLGKLFHSELPFHPYCKPIKQSVSFPKVCVLTTIGIVAIVNTTISITTKYSSSTAGISVCYYTILPISSSNITLPHFYQCKLDRPLRPPNPRGKKLHAEFGKEKPSKVCITHLLHHRASGTSGNACCR